jgi:hypothetical protein
MFVREPGDEATAQRGNGKAQDAHGLVLSGAGEKRRNERKGKPRDCNPWALHDKPPGNDVNPRRYPGGI